MISIGKLTKYFLFFINGLVVLILWQIVFILQGAIGYQGHFVLLPIKMLPLFLFTFGGTWLLLKMFRPQLSLESKKSLSLNAGILAICISLLFQHFLVTKKIDPIKFKNKMLAHLPSLVPNQNMMGRFILAFNGYCRFLPLGSTNQELALYISNIGLESALLMEVKKLLDKKNIRSTCKEYLIRDGDTGDCPIAIQRDLYSQYNFSATGDILMMAITAVSAYEVKKSLGEKYGEKHLYPTLKSINILIESFLFTLEKSIASLERNQDFTFFTGDILPLESPFETLEKLLVLKHLSVGVEKISGLKNEALKKINSLKKNDSSRNLSSDFEQTKLNKEMDKLVKLSETFSKFPSSSLDPNQIKLKLTVQQEKFNSQLKKLKEKSFLYKQFTSFMSEKENLDLNKIGPESLNSKSL